MLYLPDNLENLSTQRLLALRDRMLKTPETADWVDCGISRNPGGKQSPDWKKEYQILKDILKNRPHIT